MHFQYFVLASLFGLTSADYAQFGSDVASYAQSLAANPSVRSMFAELSSLSPSQISQLRAAGSAFATESYGENYWTAPPAGYSDFPSPFNSFYLSVWGVESSLAVKDGVAPTSPFTGGSSQITPASASSAPSTSSTATLASPTSKSGQSTPTSASSAASTGAMSVTAASSASAGAASSSSGVTSSQSTGGAAASGLVAMGAVAGVVVAAAVLL